MASLPLGSLYISRLLRHCSVAGVRPPKSLLNVNPVLGPSLRGAATSTQDSPAAIDDYYRKSECLAKEYCEQVDSYVSLWAKNNEIYYGKERDMKNFPTFKIARVHPKVRFGILPDSWFQAFYPKTGVTGPYLLLFGICATLINKELWVTDVHFVEFIVFAIAAPIAIRVLGPYALEYFEKRMQEFEHTVYSGPLKALRDSLDLVVKNSDEEIMRANGVALLVKAKEEYVALQLEATYRERLRQIHRSVQRRLDYHVERENVRRQFQQQHLTNWVVDQVVKGITPTQEKETITNCIRELKRLATVGRSASLA